MRSNNDTRHPLCAGAKRMSGIVVGSHLVTIESSNKLMMKHISILVHLQVIGVVTLHCLPVVLLYLCLIFHENLESEFFFSLGVIFFIVCEFPSLPFLHDKFKERDSFSRR